MRIPISVPLRLFPIDQLSSGVAGVMCSPYRSAMICPLYVTTNAAVMPAGSKAASTACCSLALSIPAGRSPFGTTSPIGHGCVFGSGRALFTIDGVKNTSVFPTGSVTHP